MRLLLSDVDFAFKLTSSVQAEFFSGKSSVKRLSSKSSRNAASKQAAFLYNVDVTDAAIMLKYHTARRSIRSDPTALIISRGKFEKQKLSQYGNSFEKTLAKCGSME